MATMKKFYQVFLLGIHVIGKPTNQRQLSPKYLVGPDPNQETLYPVFVRRSDLKHVNEAECKYFKYVENRDQLTKVLEKPALKNRRLILDQVDTLFTRHEEVTKFWDAIKKLTPSPHSIQVYLTQGPCHFLAGQFPTYPIAFYSNTAWKKLYKTESSGSGTLQEFERRAIDHFTQNYDGPTFYIDFANSITKHSGLVALHDGNLMVKAENPPIKSDPTPPTISATDHRGKKHRGETPLDNEMLFTPLTPLTTFERGFQVYRIEKYKRI